LEKLEIEKALKKILEFSGYCNQYFQKNEPWANQKRATNCLYLCANAVRSLDVLLEPYLPYSTEKLWEQMNLTGSVHEQNWDSISKMLVKPEHKINKPKILFNKIEDKEIKEQKNKLKKGG